MTETPHEIYKLDNTLLESICEPFDFNNPPFDPIYLSNSLTMTRERYKGIGLAANQVGIAYRVISIKGMDSCLFNPKVTLYSPEQKVMDEGCLSFPGLIVRIKRSEVIRVRYLDAYGKFHTAMYNGLTARAVQHEMDHLDGILFFNRVSKLQRDRAFKKLKKVNKLYERV